MKLLSRLLCVAICSMPAAAQVATGIDVLEQQNFAPLQEIAARHGGHLRLGVLTNPVGIDSHERRTIASRWSRSRPLRCSFLLSKHPTDFPYLRHCDHRS